MVYVLLGCLEIVICIYFECYRYAIIDVLYHFGARLTTVHQ